MFQGRTIVPNAFESMQIMKREILIILITFTIVTFITYYSIYNNNFSTEQFFTLARQPSSRCLEKIVNQTRQCLLNSLPFKTPGKVWISLNPAIDKCTNFLQKTSGYIKIDNTEDYKFIILQNNIPYNEVNSQNCTLLTLGVGGDIEAEKKVKAYFPNCTFIGADPSYEYGKIFLEIGQFLNAAVTNKNATVTSHVLVDNRYVDRQVHSIDFYSMLQYTNTSNIDYFFMDIEGGEYNILPLLSKKYLKNFKLCQLSLEVHGSDGEAYSIRDDEKFARMIHDLLTESSYLPIFGQYVKNDGFNRMFWVDYESEFCVEKYFHDFCVYVSA